MHKGLQMDVTSLGQQESITIVRLIEKLSIEPSKLWKIGIKTTPAPARVDPVIQPLVALQFLLKTPKDDVRG